MQESIPRNIQTRMDRTKAYHTKPDCEWIKSIIRNKSIKDIDSTQYKALKSLVLVKK
jgi:hypothetical protein